MEPTQNLLLNKKMVENNHLLSNKELSNLKNKLEEEGMQKVTELIKNGDVGNINMLKDIMKSGANEFEKKTGRKMTYIEMRENYG
jgi:hypothetical protein